MVMEIQPPIFHFCGQTEMRNILTPNHSVAKFRKLGGKVSVTGKIIHPLKIETTSTRWYYGFQIT